MKRKVVLLCILFLSLCLYGQEAEEEKNSEKYELQYIEAKKFVDALPEGLKKNKIYILTDRNGFVIRCGEEEKKVVEEYIRILDEEPKATAVRLKYLSTEELLRNLPPSVNKESITVTSNPNILFFNGSEGRKEQFLKELELIDKPKAQIRYQLLVVQYEKSEDMNWTKSLEVKKSNGAPMSEFSGVMSNIFNINFDIVSKFGYQFIAKLSFELSENKARVLADTTLNGLTGEEVKFQNTNTFRYIDKTLDSNGKPLYGSMREITSGLLLNIKGNVSGDEMITMEVNAQVSKQGSGGVTSGVLPPTSEKIVKTKVRTQSGTPIIIGGLLQAERNSSEKKVPGLGDIPIAGMLFKDTSGAETVTEMVIYIVPYLHREKEKKEKKSERLMRLYKKYVEEEAN
jgi:conserved domain protein